MNNGKVRIYELSRELNLDNREILAVCDQLNISVKSHSSTISDVEAARIRTAAEKFTPSHSSSQKPTVSMPSKAPKSRQSDSESKPVAKKPQILELRTTRTTTEPPKRPEPPAQAADEAAVGNISAPPSRPPAALAEVTPDVGKSASEPPEAARPEAVRPEAPSRPQRPAAEMIAPLTPPASAIADEPEAVAESPVAVDEPVNAEPIHEVVAPPPPIEVADLVAPPSRPVAKTPDAARASTATRPILKRAKPQAGEQQAATSQGSQILEVSRPNRVDAPSRPVAPTTAEGGPPQLRAKPVIELRRKPTRPTGDQPAAGQEGGVALAPGPVRELADGDPRRPAHPTKNPKRGKAWEEEEEEQEAAQKVAKAGTKAKRRTPTVVDEDDDDIAVAVLDDEDGLDESDENTAVQVNLSLMRPPKPKSSRPSQSKPTTIAAPTRRKAGASESRGFRRDRREQEVKQRPEKIVLTGSLSVSDLADELAIAETEIIKALFFKGIAANINQILDIPTATMVAQEMGVEVETGEVEAEAKKVTEMIEAGDLDSLVRRPPVVTIMGHVDHGKTTLLDSIRKTKVAQGEAGGITQHIGAYHVDVEHNGNSQQVVFLDTPGHAAFTAMRARGTRVTDIAVLVVAADDGVRPQTIEAISHAKAAEVPIVVAINKIDKEEAQPDRVKQELTEFGLVPEEWGGSTIMVPVSAINGENLDTLLEMLLLVAEVEDLYANPTRLSKGTVIEANLDKAKGPVATLLVQNGTLRVGDVLVAGSVFGKVRAMVDDRGHRVDQASPSFAVEVLGLSDVPAAGDEFEVFAGEKEARSVASGRSDLQRLSRLQQAMASRRVSLNTLSAKAQEGDLKELNLILKGDVQGSVEAILNALQQLPQKEVQLRVLLAAPGEITETDVDLAAASDAVILGFNTTFASGARQAADQAGVDVRDYSIIYKLLEEVQGAMEGLLDPEMVEEPLGQVEVRAVFPVGRGAVAGCYILSGKAIRNCRVRVLRRGQVVHEGNLDSLKRMKEDTKEVNAGYECGIGLDNFKNWEVGDIIETFRLVSTRRVLTA